MSLLEKIKASGYHKKETKWPGTDHIIHLRVLNENDHLQATIATDSIFSKTTISIQNIDKYNSELETQYLYRGIEDPESGKRLFKDITVFRENLSPEVKDILSDELDALHEEYSPDPYKMSSNEFDKLTLDLKKNCAQTVGQISSIFIARKLITYLVKRRKK